MKHLVAVLVVFFLVPMLLLAQENIPGTNIVVLPPFAATRTPTRPPSRLRAILDAFQHYQKELHNLPTSDWPPDLWWIVVMLMPDKGHERWLINITTLKEEKGAEIIVITQIPITGKTA